MSGDLKITDDARARQLKAGDPRRLVWVTANAGSGKTYVLAERVVRLLLEGVDPARILCLTYTKTAAANMRAAVFKRLSRLATGTAAEVTEELASLDVRAGDRRIALARTLFANALETPGGLKIQTIHAFCESVLRRFPLEANIAGRFELLQGASETALLGEARRALLSEAAAAASPAGHAFARVFAETGEAGLERLMTAALAMRRDLTAFIGAARGSGGFAPLRESLGIAAGATEQSLAAAVWPAPGLDDAGLRRLVAAAQAADAKNFLKWVGDAALAAITIADPVARADALVDAFLKTPDEAGRAPYKIKNFVTKAMELRHPGAGDHYLFAATHILEASDRLNTFRLFERTVHALTLAESLISRVEAMKRRRGLLDFNDLIDATRRLLTRPGVGPWVRYKLDAGIDHILLDEAQDTSPAQWAVMRALSEEIFDGAAAAARRRTLFVVGDPKQSIYSFQGARPESFANEFTHYKRKAAHLGAAGVQLEMKGLEFNASFRTGPVVLQAVDQVFSHEDVRQGVAPDSRGTAHTSLRPKAPGRVDVWPPLIREKREDTDDWTAIAAHEQAPEARLALRIATTVAGWVREGRCRPGDVLVLVRKRGAFIHALARELKNADVPVGGVDRLRLTDHIAVKDLLALASIALQPADDLSLAALLKSPVFGFDDDDLLALAAGRPEGRTLLAALQASAVPAHAAAAARIALWRGRADSVPVYEFFARALGEDGLRRRFAARLGHEVEDILDEFLLAAENAERDASPGLGVFLQAMLSSPPEIKRELEQDRNEVRIMTVHAAKGLEAPHVFLVDGFSKASSASHQPPFAALDCTAGPLAGRTLLLWAVGAPPSPPRAAMKAAHERRAADEYRRLLYVAMTRAKDTLTVCGHAGAKPADDTWHGWIRAGLLGAPHAEEIDEWPEGRTLRFRFGPPERPCAQHAAAAAPEPFAFGPLPPEPLPPRPFAPSAAALLIEEDGADAPHSAVPVFAAVSSAVAPDALLRGTLMHRLLQRLPAIAPERRYDAALLLLRRAAGGLGLAAGDAGEDAPWMVSLAREAAAVLAAPDFAPLLAAPGRAEVAVMGRLVVRGVERAVSGKVDRIVETPDAVTLIDFKAGRLPAAGPQPGHVLQLALYRLLLRPVFAGRPVGAALIHCAGPTVTHLDKSVMDAALAAAGVAAAGP